MAERKPAKKPAPKAKAEPSKPGRLGAMNIAGFGRSKASKPKPAKAKKAAAAKAPAAKPAAKKKPPPNMQERMEGLQGWMAEIERKQERMTRFGGAAALVAVLAAGGAIALGVINQQNAATKDDVDDLTEQVNELGASVKTQTETGLKKLNTRISALESQITTIQAQQTTDTADIAALKQSQAAAATTGKGAGNGLTPALPGAKP